MVQCFQWLVSLAPARVKRGSGVGQLPVNCGSSVGQNHLNYDPKFSLALALFYNFPWILCHHFLECYPIVSQTMFCCGSVMGQMWVSHGSIVCQLFSNCLTTFGLQNLKFLHLLDKWTIVRGGDITLAFLVSQVHCNWKHMSANRRRGAAERAMGSFWVIGRLLASGGCQGPSWSWWFACRPLHGQPFVNHLSTVVPQCFKCTSCEHFLSVAIN